MKLGMWRPLISIVMILLLVGCQTPQKTQSELRAAMQADAQEGSRYCKELGRDQRIEILGNKVAFLIKDTNLKMRANNNYATQRDKEALLVYAELRERCAARQLAGKKRFSPPIHPGYIAIDEIAFSKFRTNLTKLYNGEITFGEFAALRDTQRQMYLSQRNELRNAIQKSNAEAEFKAHQLHIESRKASAMEEQARAASRSAINDMYRSNTITCVTSGNVTTCN